MRNFILVVTLVIALTSCKKDVPKSDVIKLKVYSTLIYNTNNNEPEVMYWYLRTGKSGTIYYYHSTQRIVDFSEYTFQSTQEMPEGLIDANELPDIVVLISNLNGEIGKDI